MADEFSNPSVVGGVTIGDTVTNGTAGSVLFLGAAGIIAQDNAYFFWDTTNKQLQLNALSATKTPLQISMFAAQSAHALQVLASDAKVKFAIDSDGGIKLGGGTGDASTNSYFGIARLSSGGMSFLARVLDANPCMFVSPTTTEAFRIASGYQVGWSSSTPGAAANDTGLARVAAMTVKITNGSTGPGCLQLQETTAPSAPAADNVIIYAVDNGSGKTQLMALFSSGAAQQLAIQP